MAGGVVSVGAAAEEDGVVLLLLRGRRVRWSEGGRVK